MNDSLLRAINPTVPLRDLEAAVWIVIAGILVAHVIVVPKLLASAPRHALVLLGLSFAGLGLACLFVLDNPADFLSAVLAYCAWFAALSIFIGWKASAAARRAAVLVCIGLLVMILLVYLLAFSAR